MTAAEIDAYLAQLPEPKRGTLQAVRESIRRVLPEAEEGISYRMPAFRLDGKVVAGFAAFTNYVSYLPHSGSVLAELASILGGFEQTKSWLHFPVETPLPDALVAQLVEAKLRQLGH